MKISVQKHSYNGINIDKINYENIESININNLVAKSLNNLPVINLFMFDKYDNVHMEDITPTNKYYFDVFIYKDDIILTQNE